MEATVAATMPADENTRINLGIFVIMLSATQSGVILLAEKAAKSGEINVGIPLFFSFFFSGNQPTEQ